MSFEVTAWSIVVHDGAEQYEMQCNVQPRDASFEVAVLQHGLGAHLDPRATQRSERSQFTTQVKSH